ncbi:MAG: patatin-like phospholipase family protein [Alphaproteobacteria bacterium]|nr:patatin-like phospholipase family protein [Alphaproteobacteria bacterium]
MSIEIKCIFQGGGAKLATMIAVCEIIEEMENDEIINVTMVAGTSAGSIAACVLAHSEPTKILRKKMVIAGQNLLPEVSRKRNKYITIFKALRGKTIFPKNLINKFVRGIFTENESDRPALKSLQRPVFVRVADIRGGSKFTYRNDATSLEKALAESCAIPIAFTSHKSAQHYVDGGVVSNLIDGDIFGNDLKNIIAFSFPQSDPYEYNDFLSYCKSIISTAIDASISDSVTKIRSGGGYVCMLPNDFKTFDFSEALTTGLSDDYVARVKADIKNQINAAIRHFIDVAQVHDDKERVESLNEFCASIASRLGKVYRHGVTNNTIICIAHGLDRNNQFHLDERDILIKQAEIIALDSHLMSFKIGITKTESFGIGKTLRYEVTDKCGNHIGAAVEVVRSTQKGKTVWHAQFCLNEPLLKEATPVTVRLRTSHKRLMANLLSKGGTEWMRAESHQDDAVVQQDFVLCAPQSLGKLTMVDLLQNVHRTRPRLDETEMAGRWAAGARMTESELAEYTNEVANLPGFDIYGWRVKAVPAKSFSGMLIERDG